VKLDPPVNNNYAAVIVRVPAMVDLPKLDFLAGVPVLGHQALTQRDGTQVGDLKVVLTAETQLSEDYCAINNLYRDETLNKDPAEKGYLEKNRRIRALKLRGHVSNALLMPLSSLVYTGIDVTQLKEGDTFDHLNGHDICQKYEIPVRRSGSHAKPKIEKAFKRVDKKIFPEHLETDQYWRSKHLLKPGREVVVTQKLHGTSLRVGNVPCAREKGFIERLFNRFFETPDYRYDVVFGSRKVIKDVNNPNQDHFYDYDLWSYYGTTIASVIPEGYIIYGELIGWTPPPSSGHNQEFIDNVPEAKRVEVLGSSPIQKNYTYHLPPGKCELYVYRVATINAQGTLADLSWDGVKDFCTARGLKWCPELVRLPIYTRTSNDIDWDDESPYDAINDLLDRIMDSRYAEGMANAWDDFSWTEAPVPLSDKKTVDEGVCLRQDGVVPLILKAKSAVFLEHETKLLDRGEVDMESAETPLVTE
jgi:hypothetical protein